MRIRDLGLASMAVMLTWAGTAPAQQYGWYPAQATAYSESDLAAAEDAAATPATNSTLATGSCTDGACCDDDCCCDECCDDCLPAWCCWRPAPGWFGSGEFVMWWTKERSLPPLAATAASVANDYDTANQTVLFGGDDYADGLGHGGRLTVGKWLGDSRELALVGKFTAFRADDAEFSAASDGLTNLAIPFINAQTGDPSALLIGFTPDNGGTAFASGDLAIQDRIDTVAFEAYAQSLIYARAGRRLDVIGGYHAMRLDNSLSVVSNSISLDPIFLAPVGTRTTISDIFEGRNEFHGGSLGLNFNADYGRWWINAMGKVSFGNMRQSVVIDGLTVIDAPGNPLEVRDEGLFAVGTNQGRYERDRAAYIPEASLTIGYKLRENLGVSMGYSFMYVSSVVLAGDQLDTTVNVSQLNGGPLVGPAAPLFQGFRDTDFWMQGLNFAVELSY